MCKCMCTLLAVIQGVAHLHHPLCPAITHGLVCLPCLSFNLLAVPCQESVLTLLLSVQGEGGGKEDVPLPVLQLSEEHLPGLSSLLSPEGSFFYLVGILEVSLEHHPPLASPLGPAHVQGCRRRSGPAPLVRLPRRSSVHT